MHAPQLQTRTLHNITMKATVHYREHTEYGYIVFFSMQSYIDIDIDIDIDIISIQMFDWGEQCTARPIGTYLFEPFGCRLFTRALRSALYVYRSDFFPM